MKNQPVILVVDDQVSNLLVLESMLLPLGYHVEMAKNGLEALKKVAENSPDLVLLDILMPLMDGFETCRKIKANPDTQNIPVVMVTALVAVEDRVKALEAGADDFLTKPVDKTEVRARVKSLLKVKAYNDFMKGYQQELEDEVTRQTEELREAFLGLKTASLETIVRLSRAAEYKDEDTGAHVLRMCHYAAAIARRVGLSEEHADKILHAAPMHDIGKIGIPDKILMKPGKLTDKEWEIMKQHTVIGRNILSGSEAEEIKLGEIIAYTHHEKWGGNGYPQGLKGEDIPIESRIVTVADVFDALTSKRPYKEAFPLEKAYEIIREESGKHFEPQVVDAFFLIKNDILEIMNKFIDKDFKKNRLTLSSVLYKDSLSQTPH